MKASTRKHNKVLSMILIMAMVLSMFCIMPMYSASAATGELYVVAGDEGLTGENWNASSTENQMTDNGDGTYTKTFADVPAGSYGFKVTDGTWTNSWGKDGGSANYSLTLSTTCDVTIIFNSETKLITVESEGLSSFVLDYIVVVGNGEGNWLNGEVWNLASTTNIMTEVTPGIWEISYYDVAAGEAYQAKFACNGSWQPYNWTMDGYLDGQINPNYTVETDGSTVTIRIDVNGFDFETGEGSVVTEFVVTPPEEPDNYADVLLGDADASGDVSIKDATTVQKYIAEIMDLPDNSLLSADANCDVILNITDVTIIQKYLADFTIDYSVGQVVRIEDPVYPTRPTEPETTEPTTEPDASEPVTDPIPTDPVETMKFYVPNYVSWLTDAGGKLWLYNDDTAEFMAMSYDEEGTYFWADMPVTWDALSIYRTPFEITEETFDITSAWDEATQTGAILNKWENLGSKGDYNCYKITADGEGFYTTYDPTDSEETERTIYFDNSLTQWDTVYIYGWSFGLNNEFYALTQETDTIWSFTFSDTLPVDGVNGFLFVNQDNWTGCIQSNDVATAEGKNLYVPTSAGSAGTKISGAWSVYTP